MCRAVTEMFYSSSLYVTHHSSVIGGKTSLSLGLPDIAKTIELMKEFLKKISNIVIEVQIFIFF